MTISNPLSEIDMSKNKYEVRKDDGNKINLITDPVRKDDRDEVNLKNVDLRLTSVKEAIQRSRFVFLVMTIASSAILFTLWNDRFSRDKSLAFDTGTYTTRKPTDQNTKTDEPALLPLHIYGRQQLVAEWYKNRIIQIGLLGIRLSVSDLSLIGSFTLVVITIWFYYSQRSENQALVTLLRDVHEGYRDKTGLPVREMVYQGIKHSLVFIRTEVSDEPLEGLVDSPRTSSSPEREGKSANVNKVSLERKILTDRVYQFLSFLPFWAIVAILLRDFSALLMKSPTTSDDRVLGKIIIGTINWDLLTWQTIDKFWDSFYPIFMIILFDSFAICCAIYTRILCNRSRGFAEGSKKTLKEFEESLNETRRLETGSYK